MRDEELLDKPSIESDWCVFCGRPRTEYHHIVYRSHGGTDGPVVAVCGAGNASGCHGMLHSGRLHLDWRDGGWRYLKTDQPVSHEQARQMKGWLPVRTWDECMELQ